MYPMLVQTDTNTNTTPLFDHEQPFKVKKMNGRTPSGKSAQVGPIEDLLRFRDRFRTLSISTLHWVIFKVPVGSKKRISSMHQPDSSVWQKVQ